MKKYLSLLLIAGMAISVQQAQAQETSPTPHKAAKKAHAKKGKSAAKHTTSTDEEEKTPDISASTGTDFSCAQAQQVTIYRNADDAKHIALRWHKHLYPMSRVDTSSGADRFENHKLGLVWIGIPAKGMLLDSKKGHQLANECRNAQQMTPQGQDTPKG